MAVPILKRVFSLHPLSGPVTRFFASSLPESPVSAAVSILSHHRCKSRWSYLHSLFPCGFTPDQFSQIALCLRNNPHLALRFFLFTQHKSLCGHSLSSYSTIIHVLARGRLKSHARSIIREAIRASESEYGSSNPVRVFESLVRSYRECGSAPFVFDLLIKACLESKQVDGAVNIARMLMSRRIGPKVCTCNALIWEVSRSRGADAGYAIYREIFGVDDGKRVVNPNVHTYNALMECFYRDGAVERVEEVWVEIGEMNCVPNVYSYSLLMAAYGEVARMGELVRLWEEMRAKEIEPDILAYNTIIGGFCNIGEIERAEEFYREMEFGGMESTGVTYEHLIKGYCKVGDIDSAILLLKDMRRKDFMPEALTIDTLVTGLCCKGRVSEALDIFRAIACGSSFSPKGERYRVLIKGLCEEGKMQEALKLQAELVEKGFEPNSLGCSAFFDGHMKQGN